MDFYTIAGKEPVRLKKEIPGFIATRLQEALWREALHMVANGEATPEDIDRALRFGPAPAWLFRVSAWRFMWLAVKAEWLLIWISSAQP